jgi:midasin (ATPase involved in ribosome maturation)
VNEMKKILLTILLLVLVASPGFAGQNDRFSTIELNQLDDSIGSSAYSGFYKKVVALVIRDTNTYTLTPAQRKAYSFTITSGDTNSTKILLTGPVIAGKEYMIRNQTSGSGTGIVLTRISGDTYTVTVASGYTATVIYNSTVGGFVKTNYFAH